MNRPYIYQKFLPPAITGGAEIFTISRLFITSALVSLGLVLLLCPVYGALYDGALVGLSVVVFLDSFHELRQFGCDHLGSFAVYDMRIEPKGCEVCCYVLEVLVNYEAGHVLEVIRGVLVEEAADPDQVVTDCPFTACHLAFRNWQLCVILDAAFYPSARMVQQCWCDLATFCQRPGILLSELFAYIYTDFAVIADSVHVCRIGIVCAVLLKVIL